METRDKSLSFMKSDLCGSLVRFLISSVFSPFLFNVLSRKENK